MPWYCEKCGAINDEGQDCCHNCGEVRPEPGSHSSHERPAMETGEKLAIFFCNLLFSPLVGIILYYAWKDDKPRKAEEVIPLTGYALAAWVAIFLLRAAVAL